MKDDISALQTYADSRGQTLAVRHMNVEAEVQTDATSAYI